MSLSKNEIGFLTVGVIALLSMLPFLGLMARMDFPGQMATALVNILGVTGVFSLVLFAAILTIRLCRRRGT